MKSKSNVVVRTFMAAFFLVAFTAISWRLSGKGAGAHWIVFAPPAALLLFELAGILRTYQKRSENLDKLVRWVFQMNLALMASADIVLMFRS